MIEFIYVESDGQLAVDFEKLNDYSKELHDVFKDMNVTGFKLVDYDIAEIDSWYKFKSEENRTIYVFDFVAYVDVSYWDKDIGRLVTVRKVEKL